MCSKARLSDRDKCVERLVFLIEINYGIPGHSFIGSYTTRLLFAFNLNWDETIDNSIWFFMQLHTIRLHVSVGTQIPYCKYELFVVLILGSFIISSSKSLVA